jgi:beta-lactamase class D
VSDEDENLVKSKEVDHAEKIYATLRECREQSGLKKTKGSCLLINTFYFANTKEFVAASKISEQKFVPKITFKNINALDLCV